GRIVNRRAVGNDHENPALLGALDEAVVRPQQRFAVDVLLEDAFAQHQAEGLSRAPPGRLPRLVGYWPQGIQSSRIGRLPGIDPGLARLATLPHTGGEAEDLDLHAATLERARQDVAGHRGDRDRPAAHRA